MTLRDTRTGKTFHAEFRSNWYTITILVVTETGECIPLADYPSVLAGCLGNPVIDRELLKAGQQSAQSLLLPCAEPSM